MNCPLINIAHRNYTALNWLGHIAITTAPNLDEDATQAIGVLNASPVIPSTHLKTPRPPYWGSHYGVSDRDEHALKILREVNIHRSIMIAN